MPRNLPGVGAAPDVSQVEDMIQTAIKVKNIEHAIELTKVVLTICRMGFRRGETSHDSPWWHSMPGFVKIPPLDNCYCGHCKQKAKTRAQADDEDRDWKTIFEDDMWRPKTLAGARLVPKWHSPRLNSTVRKYHTQVLDRRNNRPRNRPPMSPKTVARRYRKVAELTPSIENPGAYTPRGGRAAAAMYWARILDLGDLMALFGWEYPQTAAFYFRKALIRANQKIEWAFNVNRPFPEQFYQPAPEFDVLRPDEEKELIELDTIQPETTVSSSEVDDEEALMEQGALADFAEDANLPEPEEVDQPTSLQERAMSKLDDAQTTFDDLRERVDDRGQTWIPASRRLIKALAGVQHQWREDLDDWVEDGSWGLRETGLAAMATLVCGLLLAVSFIQVGVVTSDGITLDTFDIVILIVGVVIGQLLLYEGIYETLENPSFKLA